MNAGHAWRGSMLAVTLWLTLGCAEESRRVFVGPPNQLRDLSGLMLISEPDKPRRAWFFSDGNIPKFEAPLSDSGIDVFIAAFEGPIERFRFAEGEVTLGFGGLLPALEFTAQTHVDAAGFTAWNLVDLQDTPLAGLRIQTLDVSCTVGFRDGGDGRCVGPSVCSPGFGESGDGRCLGGGVCVRGEFDPEVARCVILPPCPDDLWDQGGDGTCWPAGLCSVGYLDDIGNCFPDVCPGSLLRDEAGTCRCPGGKTADWSGSGVLTCACAELSHQGGGGTCVPVGECSPSYSLARDGRCRSFPGPLVFIEKGSFTMGSPSEELRRDIDEGPQHPVTLTRDIWVQSTEVTRRQWEEAMGARDWTWHLCAADCPAGSVNWYEAVTYLNRISELEGLPKCYAMSNCSGTAGDVYTCETVDFLGPDCAGFRLPTEAEWEYFARAGTSSTALTAGPFTLDTPDCLFDEVIDRSGWYCGNSTVTFFGCVDVREHQGPACIGPQLVGLKPANAWGLYDVHGNVDEWVQDWYAADYYSVSPSVDPAGPASGTSRVTRGGGWNNRGYYCRFASRISRAARTRQGWIGFRAVRTAL